MDRSVARSGDLVFCIKHILGTIAPVDRDVLVNKKLIAAVSDSCACFPTDLNPGLTDAQYMVPNKLMAGAEQVLVRNLPVSALLHNAQHNNAPPAPAPNGFVLTGSPDVLVGGNIAVGNAAAALAACMAAAASRRNPYGRQSYNNCGCEAMRELAAAATPYNAVAGEDDWMNRQMAAGNAQTANLTPEQQAEMDAQCKSCKEKAETADPMNPGASAKAAKEYEDCKNAYKASAMTNNAQRKDSGGTQTSERDKMASSGAPATEGKMPSAAEMAQAAAEGRGCAAAVNEFPSANGETFAQHVVNVTGVVVDENGNVKTVVYNDPAAGCGDTMNAKDFQASLNTANAMMNVTKQPVY